MALTEGVSKSSHQVAKKRKAYCRRVVTGEEVMDQTIPTGVAPPFIEVNSFGLLSHCFAPLALRPCLAFVVAA
jgi:hypothetical protein